MNHHAPLRPAIGRTETIQAFVAGYYAVPAKQMLLHNQGRAISGPRQVAMYVVRELTGQSLPEIGRRFNRDHSTVHHAITAVRDRIECNPRVAADVALLLNRLVA